MTKLSITISDILKFARTINTEGSIKSKKIIFHGEMREVLPDISGGEVSEVIKLLRKSKVTSSLYDKVFTLLSRLKEQDLQNYLKNNPQIADSFNKWKNETSNLPGILSKANELTKQFGIKKTIDSLNDTKMALRSYLKSLKQCFAPKNFEELKQKFNSKKSGWMSHNMRTEDNFIEGKTKINLGIKGKNFDAHGIEKGRFTEQLEQLNKLLSQGIDKTKPFYTAPLDLPSDLKAALGPALGTSSGCAYNTGGFMIVAQKGEKLIDSGIKYVIVNKSFYSIFEDLQRLYPQQTFIKMKDVDRILGSM